MGNKRGQGESTPQSAIIVFENDEAAKTAIFLNDTFIIDSPINVVPYNGEVSPPPVSSASQPSQANNNQQQQSPGLLVNTLASAYMFGAKAWQKVVEFDKKYHISESIQAQAQKVDNSLGLSQKSQVASEKISEVADNLDKSLKITESTNKIATKSNEKLEQLKHRNEKTEKFFQNLENLGKKISTTWEESMKVAQQKVDLVKAEIQRREEEERRQHPLENQTIEVQESTSLLSDTDNAPLEQEHANANNNTSN